MPLHTVPVRDRSWLLRGGSGLALLAMALLPRSGGAQEHTVAAAQVPAAVRESFRRAYPNATALKYSTERENNRTVYEIESREGDTRRDLLFAADGTILETETLLTPEQLPAPVRAAANGARITRAELTVTSRDTTYELVVAGRRGEMKLRPDGTPAPDRP